MLFTEYFSKELLFTKILSLYKLELIYQLTLQTMLLGQL